MRPAHPGTEQAAPAASAPNAFAPAPGVAAGSAAPVAGRMTVDLTLAQSSLTEAPAARTAAPAMPAQLVHPAADLPGAASAPGAVAVHQASAQAPASLPVRPVTPSNVPAAERPAPGLAAPRQNAPAPAVNTASGPNPDAAPAPASSAPRTAAPVLPARLLHLAADTPGADTAALEARAPQTAPAPAVHRADAPAPARPADLVHPAAKATAAPADGAPARPAAAAPARGTAVPVGVRPFPTATPNAPTGQRIAAANGAGRPGVLRRDPPAFVPVTMAAALAPSAPDGPAPVRPAAAVPPAQTLSAPSAAARPALAAEPFPPSAARPAVPAGSPAPMELRRAPAAAGTLAAAPVTQPAFGESGGIPTVRRTLRRTVEKRPPAVAVRALGETAAPPKAAPLEPAEVERIAEKVYRQIEQRLRSEKMRRGM